MDEPIPQALGEFSKVCHYRLDRIFTSLNPVKILFGSRDHDFVRPAYRKALRFHKAQIEGLQDAAGCVPVKVMRRSATLMYLTYDTWRGVALAAYTGRFLRGWQTWRAFNCRPAGGKWTLFRGVAVPACELVTCPWCHIRKVARLSKELRSKYKDKVTITKFLVKGVKAVVDNQTYRESLTECKLKMVKMFGQYDIRLSACNLLVDKDTSVWITSHSFLSPGDLTLKPNSIYEDIVIHRRVVRPSTAARLACPYPVDLLGLGPEHVVRFLTHMKRRRLRG